MSETELANKMLFKDNVELSTEMLGMEKYITELRECIRILAISAQRSEMPAAAYLNLAIELAAKPIKARPRRKQ